MLIKVIETRYFQYEKVIEARYFQYDLYLLTYYKLLQTLIKRLLSTYCDYFLVPLKLEYVGGKRLLKTSKSFITV